MPPPASSRNLSKLLLVSSAPMTITVAGGSEFHKLMMASCGHLQINDSVSGPTDRNGRKRSTCPFFPHRAHLRSYTKKQTIPALIKKSAAHVQGAHLLECLSPRDYLLGYRQRGEKPSQDGTSGRDVAASLTWFSVFKKAGKAFRVGQSGRRQGRTESGGNKVSAHTCAHKFRAFPQLV